MAPRGEVRLTFVFGPSPTPVLPAALAYAGRHADDLQPDGPGSWRATFRLGNSPGRLGRALQLARMVSGWRATHMEVQGSPEDRQVVLRMLTCARVWAGRGSLRYIRTAGRGRLVRSMAPGMERGREPE